VPSTKAAALLKSVPAAQAMAILGDALGRRTICRRRDLRQCSIVPPNRARCNGRGRSSPPDGCRARFGARGGAGPGEEAYLHPADVLEADAPLSGAVEALSLCRRDAAAG
jgi:hypothetical protein